MLRVYSLGWDGKLNVNGKDSDGGGRVLFEGNIPAFACRLYGNLSGQSDTGGYQVTCRIQVQCLATTPARSIMCCHLLYIKLNDQEA